MTRVVTLLGALLTALALTLVTVPAAHAASTNCAFYGDGIRWGVRNGQVCSTVGGSGTYVSRVTANFGTTIAFRNQVCNPSIKMDVYNRYGQWIDWKPGPTRFGCYPWNSNDVYPIEAWRTWPGASGGFVRVTLQHYGSPVATTHHYLG